MTTILPVGNNVIGVYTYEQFSYTISNPNTGVYTLQTPSNTPGLGIVPSPFIVKNGNTDYVFSSTGPSNTLTSGTTETFYLPITDLSGNVSISSNFVNISPGRFLDASGNSMFSNSYTFYAKEPVTPIALVAPFALSVPISVPTLPPGLTFTSNVSNQYDITGTPSVTVPQSNYLIIGKDTTGSKIVTTNIKILVGGERVLLNLSGTPIINMSIGIPITPRVVTALFPPYPSVPTNLRYTIPGLPDGLYLADSSGNQTPLPYSFVPTDPSSTVMIKGTPTSNAAYSYVNAGITSNTVNLTASRISLPPISNVKELTFAFNETVLFDQTTPTALTVYNGVTLDPSANYFHAQTYFGTSAISNISALSLPDGLSLTFVPSSARAYLTGTPTTDGSNTYDLNAINSNATTRDYSIPISVVEDYITWVSPTPATDTSYNFIVSRPVSNPKTGYYPYPIRFSAITASGVPVTYSAPSLGGTGLTLDASSTSVVIGGFPTTVTSLTDLIVTATATGSPATLDRQVKFAVLNDVFTLSNVGASNFLFTQNIPITSFQISGTTLSERPINNFSSTGFPTGVTISGNGLVSGTPTSSASGTVTIFPTTGYVTGSNNFAFTVTPDSILFTTPQLTYVYPAGANVSIPVTALSYSGKAVSNFSTTDLIYGPTINSVTGLISGALSDSIPPNVLLPLSAGFSVNGTVGSLTGILGCGITTSNPILYRSFLTVNPSGDGNVSNGIWTNDALYSSNLWSNQVTLSPSDGSIPDFQIKNDTIYSNVFIGAINGPSKHFVRSIYGSTFTIDVNAIAGSTNPTITSLTNRTGTSEWWAVGNESSDTTRVALYNSTDDGESWSFDQPINASGSFIRTRDYPTGGTTGYYLPAGANIRYSSNVLMVGGMQGTGTSMARSTDYGNTWSSVTGAFQGELAYYCLDNSSTWVATGSDYTTIVGPPAPIFPATSPPSVPTIRYSTDQGATWAPATGGFDMFGYDIVYASNIWVATGVDVEPTGLFQPKIKYSTDGQTWSNVNTSFAGVFTVTCPQPPLEIGPVMYDGSNWNIFYNAFDIGAGAYITKMYYKPDILSGSWSSNTYQNFPNQTTGPLSMSVFKGHAVPTGETNPVVSTFIMGNVPGPTFTAPVQHEFYLFQYIPITPIQVSAVHTPSIPVPINTSTVYFFVIASTLPPGLSFDKNTNTIYGTPCQIGTFSTAIYAKNTSGYNLLVLTFTVTIPRIIRQQDGAGAYTSLVRQYTQVNAAQNARDNKTYPAIDSTLGEFMAPPAPDVVTQTIDPCCKNPQG